MPGDRSSDVDVVILTAVPVEFSAVVAALGGGPGGGWPGDAGRDAGSGQPYRTRLDGQSVVVPPPAGMGTDRATLAAQRAVDVWNPARLLLVGYTGGIPAGSDDLRLGDVLIPDQVVGYELAKLEPGGVRRRWDVFRPDPVLLRAANDMPPAAWVHSIGVGPPDGSDGRTVPRRHIGPVLSGDKVIADAGAIGDLRTSWPKAVGVEMESVGVALVSYLNGPGFLMVKGVSDHADAAKDNSWHAYAAAAAAAFAVEVLRRAAPVHAAERVPPVPNDRPLDFPGRVKLHVCRHLGPNWRDVATLFDVPRWEEDRFVRGDEAREMWHWLADRGRLYALPAALREIGRDDLADVMTGEPSARDDRSGDAR